VGADGATHAGSFDLSYARCVPNLSILAPADERECRLMLQTGYQHPGPALVRYPRGKGVGAVPESTLGVLPWGRGERRREGREIAILSFGTLLDRALTAAEHLDATVANMRFVKPLDEGLVRDLALGHRLIVTLEENAVAGGAGSAVNECLAALGLVPMVLNLGLPDRYIEQATQDEQRVEAGLSVEAIVARIRSALSSDLGGRSATA
jgi:1-deoxy-D-xylulose-5-phosphate synthase